MTKYQQIAEPDGDGTPSRHATDELTGTGSQSAAPIVPVVADAPVYLTRREAREAERRAAAESALSTPPAVSASPAASVAPAVAEPVLVTEAATLASEPVSPRRAARLTAASGVRPGEARRVKTARTQRPAPRRETSAGAPRTAGATFRRTTKRVTVVGAMLFAGSMLVATSVPANAFFVDTPTQTAAKKASDSQSYTAAAPTTDGTAGIARDGYSVTEMRAVSEYASTSASTFSNDVDGTVQWPFQTGVPISSGFGARQVANCGFCSTFHQGLDFVPGAGSPIQSIADGVVSKVDGPSGALGNNVWIDHVVNGQKVTSVYAHMQTGSVEVREGETVTVGTIIGKVGSTGNSTGAHLHFEIVIGGVPVDPYPWLEANTN
ncbi:M23 family metallopeptidase [Frigoribacterium sp. PhB24]|uniref:M23 family metallopeptidase n=1 Tax=Frigoribacterium sp. PhB24 TaxID=2485204 RepID=UPI000F49CAA6|nr:M23 family metallopeptidase [Frigoribacterium sp. PhB24]ROS52821.1 peptidase M23-like protein [Frigoribacterium sp. PhB24]